MPKLPQNKRRAPRISLDRVETEAEIQGTTLSARISDLSELGVRLVVDTHMRIERDQEIRVALGKITPNIRGRVRWISPSPDNPEQKQIGVSFESLLLELPHDEEIQDLLNAWRDISHAYSLHESFLHILEVLDSEIVDGRIDDIGEAVYGVTLWLDQRIGALNLWGVIREADGSHTIQTMVERHPIPPGDRQTRLDRVADVARKGMTQWFEGVPYLYGNTVVLEYLGQGEGEIDLLQKLAVLLGKRIQLWSKVLIKNIALQLLGDELGRGTSS